VGIEIPQEQNRRKLTNKVLELSDIACCRGGKIYGTYGNSFMARSPKCNRLQASIDVQLLVRGCVFDKYTHTTMQRAIIFHRKNTII